MAASPVGRLTLNQYDFGRFACYPTMLTIYQYNYGRLTRWNADYAHIVGGRQVRVQVVDDEMVAVQIWRQV
eukprot:1159394-Pelagomonas_calceolata.AAC.11